MRITVNLASRPFVELRPFFARLRIIMASLALLAIALGVVMHIERVKLNAAEAQMNEVKRQTIRAQEEKLRNEARMRQPANSAVLDRAHFLNELFRRKSFSWTAVMMDLETVLPTGVQVTAIEPAVTADGDVIIRLRVAGDRDRAVQLVRNLERSSRFLAPRLSSESARKNEQGGVAVASANGAPGDVEFDILSNYNPLPVAGTPTVMKTSNPLGAKRPVAAKSKAKRGAVRPGRGDGVVLKPFVAPARSGGGVR